MHRIEGDQYSQHFHKCGRQKAGVKKILMSILVNRHDTEKHIFVFLNSVKSAGGTQVRLLKVALGLEGGSNLLRMKILTCLQSGGVRDHACFPSS